VAPTNTGARNSDIGSIPFIGGSAEVQSKPYFSQNGVDP